MHHYESIVEATQRDLRRALRRAELTGLAYLRPEKRDRRPRGRVRWLGIRRPQPGLQSGS